MKGFLHSWSENRAGLDSKARFRFQDSSGANMFENLFKLFRSLGSSESQHSS